MSNQKYTWQHVMFNIHYTDSKHENHVRGGNIRKVNQKSTSFCSHLDIDDQDYPQTALFTCQDSDQKIEGHVITNLATCDVRHCGMVCSRHAQCVSFNYCDSSNTSCNSFPSNCELNSSKYGQKSKRGESFKFCVLLRKF
ncbi:uncharacterized protein LOC116292397 [Actinia tenebrosa]|uniref:Uncharacterized protein LOC116292397 n=1 Tax=Actinia tenebrosa TaxID=6105 RepID=A0A6P8HI73_ACTTE|nr:uncharacterized protein LOC116292397 [Actinia tenebrosa]